MIQRERKPSKESLVEYLDDSMLEGEIARHTYCPLSDHNTSARGFIVFRTASGWTVYCHSCHKCYRYDRGKSPLSFIKAWVNRRSASPESHEIEAKQIQLPFDFSLDIPEKGLLWLRSYGVTDSEIQRYRFGYSLRLDRLILPIFGKEGVVYWQGRRLSNDTREPKYLNLKQSRETVFFIIDNKHEVTVVVEDILSALAVARAGYNSVSLLGSYAHDSLIDKLPSKHVKIWLDPDKRKDAIKIAKRLNAYGIISCPVILPIKDPKEYSSDEIINIIEGDNDDTTS